MKKILKEFKDFISRGNVLDLAIGMIIGAAFTAIVSSLLWAAARMAAHRSP